VTSVSFGWRRTTWARPRARFSCPRRAGWPVMSTATNRRDRPWQPELCDAALPGHRSRRDHRACTGLPRRHRRSHHNLFTLQLDRFRRHRSAGPNRTNLVRGRLCPRPRHRCVVSQIDRAPKSRNSPRPVPVSAVASQSPCFGGITAFRPRLKGLHGPDTPSTVRSSHCRAKG